VQRDLAQERSARERLEMEAARTREEMARMADKSTTLQREVDQQQVELRQARQAARRQSATVGAAGDRPVPSRFGQTESEIRAEEERQRALTRAEQPQPTPTPLVDSFSELEAVLADLDAGQATQAQAAEPTPEPPQTQPVGRLVERAFALYGRGDVQRAKNVLDEVLALDPDHVDALGVRGVIAWQEGDVGGALVILEKALSLSDANPRVHNYMGIVQNSLQQHAQAEQSFRRAISLDPDYDEPLFNLAVILATTGVPRIDEARRFYERSLVLGSERNVNLERVIYP
jgi:tetratricopeptide (TPR) repeat protein